MRATGEKLFRSETKPTKQPPDPNYVMEVDEWDKQRGIDLAAKTKNLTNSEGLHSSTGLSDFINLSYSFVPKLKKEEMTGEKGRHQFVDEALKSQELETLRQGTVSNLLASELSAVHFYDQYMKLNDDEQD